jgi:hypothetical protein
MTLSIVVRATTVVSDKQILQAYATIRYAQRVKLVIKIAMALSSRRAPLKSFLIH